eukprot:gb/GEZN01000020.1/.p1 GENE.gb/GEZN01000020.1/~~gb/GEZN01000020.1/.p1  ORF type:complete len:4355 (-),score=711.85 gb/GEZN01000020.1/:393-13055(-)
MARLGLTEAHQLLKSSAPDDWERSADCRILQTAFDQLNMAVLSGFGIHNFTDQRNALKAYYMSQELLKAEAATGSTICALSGHRKKPIGLLLQFGGQGFKWLPELAQAAATYPSAARLILRVSQEISTHARSIEATVLGFYGPGFNLWDWVTEPSTRPPDEYLESAPISYPMLCLTQLVHYYTLVDNLNITPKDLLQRVKATCGHSQGIVSAVIAASSSTLAELAKNTVAAVVYMFWQGARCQQIFPKQPVPTHLAADAKKFQWGIPSPMLSVRGLTFLTLQKMVDALNRPLMAEFQAFISLRNAPTTCVVSGAVETLCKLRAQIQSIQANPNENSGRTLYNARKPNITCTFLPISVPFHSPVLAQAPALIRQDIARLRFALPSSKSLLVPVWGNDETCTNLQTDQNLWETLIDSQCIHRVEWSRLTQHVVAVKYISHVVDLGCGQTSGIGKLTRNGVEGTDVQVILGSVLLSKDPTLCSRTVLFGKPEALPFAESWVSKFSPIVQLPVTEGRRQVTPGEGKAPEGAKLVTRWTQVTGTPPVMVAGMTPCTAGALFCGAVSQAGYVVELAGGGQARPNIFRQTISDLTKLLPAGGSITVNLLFLNPRLWGFQFPLTLTMRQEGFPIEGITVAAGIPSPDNADDICQKAHQAGIMRVGFKPGTESSIKEVIEIAERNPKTTIVIQWTGGRSGGHHSFEDQFEPLLNTYSAIRRTENIVLVIGGGLGDGSSAMPWLSGEWSTQFGKPPMPCDAILLGSRMMITKECPTAPEVKEAIAATPGCSNEEWTKTHNQDGIGGIITLTSELGEPIHKLNNRGAKLWKRLSDKYFDLPAEQMKTALKTDKWDVINGINADYQKVFFGKKLDGTVVDDVMHMTYEEVLRRMVEIMCYPSDAVLASQKKNPRTKKTNITPNSSMNSMNDYKRRYGVNVSGRSPQPSPQNSNNNVKALDQDRTQNEVGVWIHSDYTTVFADFLARVHDRFSAMCRDDGEKEPSVPQADQLEIAAKSDPLGLIQQILEKYPSYAKQLLGVEDRLYFLALCLRRGKPVNFIPIIDGNLKMWFKKDSLWYSEDLKAVPDQDPDRVMVLQGPLATQFATKVDEPCKDVLDGICQYVASKTATKPSVGCLCDKAASPSSSAVRRFLMAYQGTNEQVEGDMPKLEDDTHENEDRLVFTLPVSKGGKEAELPQEDLWRAALATLPFSTPTSAFTSTVPSPAKGEQVTLGEEEAARGGCHAAGAWRRAVLLSPYILRGTKWVRNPFKDIFTPRSGQSVSLASQNIAGVQQEVVRVTDANLETLGMGKGSYAVEAVAVPATGEVHVTIKHPRSDFSAFAHGQSSPVATLTLEFRYHPSTRCNMEGMLEEEPWSARCAKVVSFYQSLWSEAPAPSKTTPKTAAAKQPGSLSSWLPISGLFGSSADPAPAKPVASTPKSAATAGKAYRSKVRQFEVAGDEIARFQAAIGDHRRVSNHERNLSPIDFGIVLAWESITEVLLAACGPDYGAADLFSLVHLSNEFKALTPGVEPGVAAGDTVASFAELTGVWDEPAGRTITVRAKLAKVKGGEAKSESSDNNYVDVLQVTSRFAIRHGGWVSTAAQRLRLFKTRETDHTLTLTTPELVAIFASKSFHTLTTPQKLGSTFRVKLRITETLSSGSSSERDFNTKGFIFDASGRRLLGKVKCQTSAAAQCVVEAFLARHGETFPKSSSRSSPGYYPIDLITAPHSNFLYALASKDVNPIHTNPYFVPLGNLPAPIVHGMHTSALCRQALARVSGGKVVQFMAEFAGMVLPGVQMAAVAKHEGMLDGRKVVTLELRDRVTDTVLLKATGQVAQPPTSYVFTGQGSATVGMGMAMLERSSADSPVRKVWTESETYFFDKYGFSLLHIIRTNPQSMEVSLNGPRGKVWRKNYAALAMEKVAQDGSTTRIQLFPEASDPNVDAIHFKSPKGLLFQTQFQQPAILLAEKAEFEELHAGAALASVTRFAGHSLGEYAAIGCLLNDAVDVPTLAEVVFLRGLTMQSAVKRDVLGRSRYAMVAVSPGRVGEWMDETLLSQIVDLLCKDCKELLQIVNYNVPKSQYVVAGHLTSLHALKVCLDLLWHKYSQQPVKSPTLQTFMPEVNQAVASAVKAAEQAPGGFLAPTRGKATIPLPGIDVPFHSRLLTDGVPAFRQVLRRLFTSGVSHTLLEGRYMPNLLGKTFRLTREFSQEVMDATNSPVMTQVLKNWSEEIKEPEQLCQTLLIELLAYQFASPVQWISTQAEMLSVGFTRVVEIGPSPVLLNMMKQSMAVFARMPGQGVTEPLKLLWSNRDMDALLFTSEGFAEQPEIPPLPVSSKPVAAAPKKAVVPAAAKKAEAKKEVSAAATPAAAMTPAAAAGGGSSAPPPAVPYSSLHALQVLVCSKLKCDISVVDPSKSVKALCGGKSALQNEIIGDIGSEFQAEIEGAEDLALTELASKIEAAGAVSGPGKILEQLFSRTMQRILPGGQGASALKVYFERQWLWDESSVNGVRLHAVIMAPNERLSSEDAMFSFLDDVARAYGKARGVNVEKPAGGAGGAAGGGGGTGPGMVAVDPEEMKALKSLMRQYSAALEEYLVMTAGETLVKKGEEAVLAVDTTAEEASEAEQSILSLVEKEHGLKYVEGIRPIFTEYKIRRFDSWWAWARQDLSQLLLDLKEASGAGASADSAMAARFELLANRSDSVLVKIVELELKEIKAENPENGKAVAAIGRAEQLETLLKLLKERLEKQAVYHEYRQPSLPKTTITSQGIQFEFTPRYPMGFIGYVEDMMDKKNPNCLKLLPAIPMETFAPIAAPALEIKGKETEVSTKKKKKSNKKKVSKKSKESRIVAAAEEVDEQAAQEPSRGAPMLLNDFHTDVRAAFEEIAAKGMTLDGKVALITGAGRNSIGLEVVRTLLLAGCTVVVTTSSPNRSRFDMYEALYKKYGGKSGKLVVVPWNAASQQDTRSLVDALFSSKDPLHTGGRLDFVFPFAAISENGRDISAIDYLSELAHRSMLTNVVRLLGAIKEQLTRQPGASKQPTMVVLPLSPNHGIFGGDGLYAESKIALEALFAKWKSEGWGRSLSLVGAEIGWTRGTGLMSTNDLLAQDIEAQCALRTFDTTEMAFNLVACLHPLIRRLASRIPLKADFSGGFHNLGPEGLPTARLRKELLSAAAVVKAVANDAQKDKDIGLFTPSKEMASEERQSKIIKKDIAYAVISERANLLIKFPALGSNKPGSQRSSTIHSGHHSKNMGLLSNMVDLSRVPVIAGFGEVGPWGNSRTRWEWETLGRFTAHGAIEMARAMGLIKFTAGTKVPNSDLPFIGWLDGKTNKPIRDIDVPRLYAKEFKAHCGIRFIEPDLFDGYDPKKKQFFHEVALEAKMPPFEVNSQEEIDHLKNKHGTLLEVLKEGDKTMVVLKKGAVIYVPKASVFDRLVAGQIPTGWDPKSYGIPMDLNVDPITLYALAATMDAFASAGIADPYELYNHVHVSQVGNCAGSGMGGMKSLQGVFMKRSFERDVSSDVLQETFINTTPAWINMLLLSSAGPIKTPVAACATAAASLELARETILAGKAKVMVAGGYEDFGEEGSFEFALMKATSSAVLEAKKGREPDQMCRPATTSRAGFMESQGAGIQIVMTAELAIKLGCPIYSILAGTNTATDKQGRSVPAPGQGILTTAREAGTGGAGHPLLDLGYRRRQLEQDVANVDMWYEAESERAQYGSKEEGAQESHLAFLAKERERRVKLVQRSWGSEFYQDVPEISPLRGSLAEWGLTVDDIEVASFHGTGTKANDENESEVIQLQMSHLGRTVGNPVKCIFQKWFTGHPKGAAAAWMANGLMQCILEGTIPGNRNADNIDPSLRRFEHLLFLDRTMNMGRPLKAAYLHSFGFGQAGAECVLVHPDYALAVLSDSSFSAYKHLRASREAMINRHWQRHLCGFEPLLRVKDKAVFSHDDEQKNYMDPEARSVPVELSVAGAGPALIQEPWMEFKPAQSANGKQKKGMPSMKSIQSSADLYNLARNNSGGDLSMVAGPTNDDDDLVSPSISGQSNPVVLGQLTKDLARLTHKKDGGDASDSDLESPKPMRRSKGTKSGEDDDDDEKKSGGVLGLGVDMEPIHMCRGKPLSFLDRNFTKGELAYCRQAHDPDASLTARWCAKEAVFKALCSMAPEGMSHEELWKGKSGAAAPLRNIEIRHDSSNAPHVRLSGIAQEVAQQLGVNDRSIRVSMSHTMEHAVANAVIV